MNAGACGGQKRAPDFLELVVVKPPNAGAGNQTRALFKNSRLSLALVNSPGILLTLMHLSFLLLLFSNAEDLNPPPFAC